LVGLGHFGTSTLLLFFCFQDGNNIDEAMATLLREVISRRGVGVAEPPKGTPRHGAGPHWATVGMTLGRPGTGPLWAWHWAAEAWACHRRVRPDMALANTAAAAQERKGPLRQRAWRRCRPGAAKPPRGRGRKEDVLLTDPYLPAGRSRRCRPSAVEYPTEYPMEYSKYPYPRDAVAPLTHEIAVPHGSHRAVRCSA
jgi:hypothetical protein